MVNLLDVEQRAASEANERLIRVLAGAGSGKTKTLTARVLHLLDRGVPPAAICAVTFTKRAADELVRRLGPAGETMQASTIHSLGYRVLRSLRPGRTVADESVKRRFIREAMKDVKTFATYAECVAEIGKTKRHGLPPDHLDADVHRVFSRYEGLLKERKLWDFDDLVAEPVSIFRNDEGARARWCGVWTHLLIDEVQDTSKLQWQLLGYLGGPTTSVFIVGDSQQAIYSFRGAKPEYMLQLVADVFGGTFTDYGLRTNYRSRPLIVRTANHLIDGQAGALELRGFREEPDHPVVLPLPGARSRYDEAQTVARTLVAEHGRGLGWQHAAVLFRTNAQAEAFEAAFTEAQIPYVVVGGLGFYGRAEVKDVLAYVRLAEGFDAESLERIYNKPSRYLGKAWREELTQQGGWAAFEERHGVLSFSRRYMGEKCEQLYEDVFLLQEAVTVHQATPDAVVRMVRGALGYEKWLLGEEPDEMDEIKAENLQALEDAASRWPTIHEFLQFVALCQRTQQDDDALGCVQLSSIHRAKGLEWPVVVVAGVTDGLLPLHCGNPDEERRVFYVAVTRARDRLYVSHHGEPSAFFTQLRRYLDAEVPAPGWATGGGGDADEGGRRPDDAPDDAAGRDRERVVRDPGTGLAADGE